MKKRERERERETERGERVSQENGGTTKSFRCQLFRTGFYFTNALTLAMRVIIRVDLDSRVIVLPPILYASAIIARIRFVIHLHGRVSTIRAASMLISLLLKTVDRSSKEQG